MRLRMKEGESVCALEWVSLCALHRERERERERVFLTKKEESRKLETNFPALLSDVTNQH